MQIKACKKYTKERKSHELPILPRPQLGGWEIRYPEGALKIPAKACTVIGPENARQGIQHPEQKKGLFENGTQNAENRNGHLVSVLTAPLDIAFALVKVYRQSR